MKQKGLSQEGIKLIACVTMLIDHVAAVLISARLMNNLPEYAAQLLSVHYLMRIIGRIAFPIYCFLLVEGVYHTRNPKKYGLRLFIGMLLSEIPFDLAFSFRGYVFFDWTSNSVMVTLLLGFCMLEGMKRVEGFRKLLMILPFYILAEICNTDYAGMGILLIAVFALTRGQAHEKLLCLIGCFLILTSGDRNFQIFGIWIPLKAFALLALIPIFCYDGRKLTSSKALQWGFYLFYPVHLLALTLLEILIFGR